MSRSKRKSKKTINWNSRRKYGSRTLNNGSERMETRHRVYVATVLEGDPDERRNRMKERTF